MPTTLLVSTAKTGSYAIALGSVTMAAADVANGNHFKATNNDLLICWNNSATPYTVTLTSSLSDKNRSGTITTQAIGADEILIFGPIFVNGWQNSSGVIEVSASNLAVEFGIINL